MILNFFVFWVLCSRPHQFLEVELSATWTLVLPVLVRVTPVDLPFAPEEAPREQGDQHVACHLAAFLMGEAR